MIFYQKKSLRNLIISIIFVVIFALLMVFGLKHNPNFTPSQLIGKKAPSFTAPLSSGGVFQHKSNVEKGSWIVINFWTSSCYVCRDEARELQNFYQTVSTVNKKSPQLLSVNIQDETKIIHQWQKDFAQTFPVVEDTQGLISLNFGVTGTPETFFIDPHNLVRYRVAGTVNKKMILNFIAWLDANPNATEDESALALSKISSES